MKIEKQSEILQQIMVSERELKKQNMSLIAERQKLHAEWMQKMWEQNPPSFDEQREFTRMQHEHERMMQLTEFNHQKDINKLL